MSNLVSFVRVAWKVILATLLVYTLLMASHQGEFWPFSIYPMFSQAGDSWSRVMVRSVDDETIRPVPNPQEMTSPSALPGKPFALEPEGISVHDLAAVVNQTETWTLARRNLLRDLLFPLAQSGEANRSTALLVLRARGLPEADTIRVVVEPVALVRRDTVVLASPPRPVEQSPASR